MSYFASSLRILKWRKSSGWGWGGFIKWSFYHMHGLQQTLVTISAHSHYNYFYIIEQGLEDIQLIQNKLLRFLANKKLSDKIKTSTLLKDLNMLSVNQMNAQIKTNRILESRSSELRFFSDKSRYKASLSNSCYLFHKF